MLALAFLGVLLTGAFPLLASDDPTSDISSAKNPYASPTLILTTLYHASTAFYTYARYNRSGQTVFILAATTSGTLAAFGLWVSMFGSGSRISKRTGADKRTSGWPFKNAEASKRKLR